MSRLTATVGLAAIAVMSTGTVVATAATPDITSVAKSATSASTLKFSHEVVVDQQRSGFEPDVAIDGQDHYYSSVPNGSSNAHSFVWTSLDHAKSFQMIPGNHAQICERRRRMELVQFPLRHPRDTLMFATELTPEDSFGLLVTERPNHDSRILPSHVKRNAGQPPP